MRPASGEMVHSTLGFSGIRLRSANAPSAATTKTLTITG